MSPVKNEFLDGLVSVFVLLFCGYIVSVQGWISFRRETHKLFRFLQWKQEINHVRFRFRV